MKVIILAGGKGQRLACENTDLPKALRTLKNKPLLGYVFDSINFIPKQDIYIVVGYKQQLVRQYAGQDYNYAYQSQQLGTAHAASMTAPLLKDYDGDIFLLYCDMPLFKSSTLKEMYNQHKQSKADCTILTDIFQGDDIPHFGRVIRQNNNIVDIIEHKDCTEQQKEIREINVGPTLINSKLLFDTLQQVDNKNAQKEFYLTAVPGILIQQNKKVMSYTTINSDEIYGVNTMQDLQLCEQILNQRQPTNTM